MIGNLPGPFEWAHKNAAGAMLLGKLQLIQGVGHAEQRQGGHPAQPPIASNPDIRQPAIVSAAESDFCIRPLRTGVEKNAWIKYLSVDTEFIHMLDPTGNIAQITAPHAGCHLPTDGFGFLHKIVLAESEAEQPAYFAVDDPVSSLAILLGLQQLRPEFLLGRQQIIPGKRAFDYMSICVYPSHFFTSDRYGSTIL